MKNLSMIAAVGQNLELGYKNQLLCHLPVDLKHFKTITSGHSVIMGDRTWESLPKKPLPNRRNIVVTLENVEFPDCETVHSIEAAMELVKDEDEALAEKKAKEETAAKKESTSRIAMTPEEAAAVEKIRKRGAIEFYRGNYKAALPFYFEVLKHKRDAESFEMVGIIFEKLNKLPDAYEAYEHAFELGLTTKKNVINLGLIGEKIGKYEKAQKYLEMAIDKDPVRADVVMSYARILDKQGEFKAAGEVLAILRDSTTSYAIKKAAEAEYLKMKKKHEQAVATGAAVD